MKISETYSQFLNVVDKVRKSYKNHFDFVNECDQATQDLLHQLELGSYKERQKTATKLAKIRKERRYSKDIIQLTQPLIELLEAPENAKFVEKLKRVLGETRKIESNMVTRSYFPRVIKDLEISKHHVEE